MRRGRFNRHYHVSTDRKDWVPAGDIPELFDAMRSPRGGADQEESFQSGGSPFDDGFDEAAPTSPQPDGGSPFDDDIEDEWEEDDNWIEDSSGGVLDWIEAHSTVLVLVLLAAVVGFGWFLFTRDSFVQDTKDLDQLAAVSSQISSLRRADQDAAAWSALFKKVTGELASMVVRLESQASAQDHVKQQLLFAARDDVQRIFEDDQEAADKSHNLMKARLQRVRNMIRQQTRIDAQPPIESRSVASSDQSQQSPPKNDRTEDAVNVDSAKDADIEMVEVDIDAGEHAATDNDTDLKMPPQSDKTLDSSREPRRRVPEGFRSSSDRSPSPAGGIPGRRPTTR